MRADWNSTFTYKDGRLFWAVGRNSHTEEGTRAGTPTKNGYRTIVNLGKNYLEHVIVWEMFNGEVPNGFEVDHINRDRSDNHILNLRLVTEQQNAMNRSPNKNTSSRFKGVGLFKPNGKWRARIMINRQAKPLGYFDTEEDAARAYDKAAKQYFGEFAYLNFPEEET